ncbi:MAG: hypothetical protein MJ252_15290 [archaeon]|nr:hypothetical protein [archaeon]
MELRLITKNEGKNIVPVFWTDNYFSMLGKSKISISAQYDPELIKDVPNVEISGWNIPTQIV